MKRSREEDEEAATAAPGVEGIDEDDDNLPVGIRYRSVSSVRPGVECPYMDTICRQVGARVLFGILQAERLRRNVRSCGSVSYGLLSLC
jgi:hypothetical protein